MKRKKTQIYTMEQVLSQLAMKRVKKYIKYVDINEQDEQMLA